jgi:hypothetical protein
VKAHPSPYVGNFQRFEGSDNWFVDSEALRTDAEGAFLWIADGIGLADLYEGLKKPFPVRRVRVKVGARRVPFLQVFTYRELTDVGSVDAATAVYAQPVAEGIQDGDLVYQEQRRWMLRPGQLVHVDLGAEARRPGFYVPMQAVRRDTKGYFVYLVGEGEGGAETAERVDVTLGEGIADFRRIEATALAKGRKLVVDGTHFLEDGEAVNAFDEIELEP